MYVKQQEEIHLLRAEIARLKGQPKRPQFKSSGQQPSASVTRLLQEKTPWHKHSKGVLPIDRHQDLPVVDQCVCGSGDFKTLRTFQKVVQGIRFERNNIGYRGKTKRCLHCGKIYKSSLPDGLRGVSFDPGLKSLISYLKFGCRMTYPLILRLLNGMGVQISNGEINTVLLQNGEKLHPVTRELSTVGFGKSSHLQSDATGAKRKEKRTGRVRNQYVQVISTRLLSVFAITPRYNAQTLNRLLTKAGRAKLLVSDDGSPNGNRLSLRRQLCWVHEIRHYQKLFPFFNPHRKLQHQILNQWQTFYHLAKQYGSDPPKSATLQTRLEIEKLFDRITTQTTEYADLNNQLKLTGKKKARLLLFLDYPRLPIHNNQCEQDLRQFVIIRKISGETKSVRGDLSLARHLSVIQTARKQGLDVLATLHGLLTGQFPPGILTANIS